MFVSSLSPLPQAAVMVYQHINSDMKDCALCPWETGWAKEDICSVLCVSRSSLYRWAKIFDDFGSVTPPPSPMRGRPRLIGMAAMDAIKDIYARNSDACLNELQWHLAIHHDLVISVSALQETLVRAGLTRKVLHKIASERDEPNLCTASSITSQEPAMNLLLSMNPARTSIHMRVTMAVRPLDKTPSS